MRLPVMFALVFAIGTVSADAFAAPSKAEAAVNDDAARTRYAEGIKLYKKKKYDEARAAFLQSLAMKKRPEATFMLAQCALKSGRWLEAYRDYDTFSSEMNGEIPAKLSDLYETGRREASSHLGRLRFDVPQGAEVTVDGEKVDSVAELYVVMPGEHVVVVSHRGDSKTETVEAGAAATTTVKPAFAPKALTAAPGPRARPSTPGPEPEKKEKEPPGLLSPPQTMWPVYLAGGVGLGGLTLAAIFGGLQANANHAADVANETLVRAGYSADTCTDKSGFTKTKGDADLFADTCDTLAKNQALAVSHGSIFIPSLLVGMGGTAFAVGYYLFATKEGEAPEAKEKSSTLHFVPSAGPTGGGATLLGTF